MHSSRRDLMKRTWISKELRMQGTNWVKFSEEIPDLNKRLLIIANGKLIKNIYYLDIVDCAESYRFFPFNDESHWVSKFNVTHWMYLDSIPMPEGE
ncbi:DUF551 domain-containing protein [Providencia sp. Je.9.19]|uniref:DUF551 domain-containing protein n=1 Tax=Providencia sp. Je.9.19 TaxID=3142844 RepID=UPI003DA919A0